MSTSNLERQTLLLGAQRALLGQVPASLRAVSVALEGTVVRFRAEMDETATEDERELLAEAGTELLAEFPSPYTIDEEIVSFGAGSAAGRLEHLVFLRASAT